MHQKCTANDGIDGEVNYTRSNLRITNTHRIDYYVNYECYYSGLAKRKDLQTGMGSAHTKATLFPLDSSVLWQTWSATTLSSNALILTPRITFVSFMVMRPIWLVGAGRASHFTFHS